MAATHDRVAATAPRPPDPGFCGYFDTVRSRSPRSPMLELQPQSSGIVARSKKLRLDLRDELARVGRYGESEQVTLWATHKNLRRPYCLPGRRPRTCGGGSKFPTAGRRRRSYDRRDKFILGKSAKITPIGAGHLQIEGGFAPDVGRSNHSRATPEADIRGGMMADNSRPDTIIRRPLRQSKSRHPGNGAPTLDTR